MKMLDLIVENFDGETIYSADGFDDAVIGIDQSSMRLIYSVKKCLEILEEDMTKEDALEHFAYNVEGGSFTEDGEIKSPIWCWDIFE